MENNPTGLTTETVADGGSNPFDGKVTDHAMAWSHVSAAYGISLAILVSYMVVVNVRLKAARARNEERT